MRSALPAFPRARSASFRSSSREAPDTAARATPRTLSVFSALAPQIFIISHCGFLRPACGHSQGPKGYPVPDRHKRHCTNMSIRQSQMDPRNQSLREGQRRANTVRDSMSKLFVEVLPRVVRGKTPESGTFSSEKLTGSRDGGFGGKKLQAPEWPGANCKNCARRGRKIRTSELFETGLGSYGAACSTWYCLSFR